MLMVQKAYGNEAVNRSNDFRWYSRFRAGRELVEDDERSGRPKSTRTEVNVAAVADLVKNDRRIASWMIAESLNFPQDCSSSDFETGFGKEKIVCTCCSTSHLVKTLSRRALQAFFFFFTKLLWKMRPGVLPLCGCCWNPRNRNWWIKEGPNKRISVSFSENVRQHKSLYIYANGAHFELKKGTCLPHVSSI